MEIFSVIYIDADACPVKEETYRVADRYRVDVCVVANSWMRIPHNEQVTLEVVPGDFDAADDWIADRAGPGDIVVTADIPLAARCINSDPHNHSSSLVITPAAFCGRDDF